MTLPGFTAEHSLPGRSEALYGRAMAQTAAERVIPQLDGAYAGDAPSAPPLVSELAGVQCQEWRDVCMPNETICFELYGKQHCFIRPGRCYKMCVRW